MRSILVCAVLALAGPQLGLMFEKDGGGTVELAGLDGAVGPFAIADDGTLLLTTSAGTVVLLEAEGARVAGAVRHAAAAAFLPASRDALVADDADDQVFLLRNGGFAAMAARGLGVAAPVAVESER